ncbi:MAG: hypothetical protein CVV41_11255 [Candidatus Riflebacteria bacterium HGW-Riflebacteria-1]|jgi:prepilin-type N-terminal cleavage/methylation domain-containing protein|nr:MAG: hypothetical protein CVV41_11255 [Candidatus Riflebacteria bacterium HGW-Riflebacteria-1]
MKRGFSLIELLVVVAIIAILVGVAAPYYADYVKESKRAKALQDLDVLKQAIILYNSQEDQPYLGILGTGTTSLPMLGENDFNGLMGRYLTYIPVDPWGKNYKLDPYACFVYSEGPNSNTDDDDIRDYYVKDVALKGIEWRDINNNRAIDTDDLLFFSFNKSVYIDGGIQQDDFDIYENNQKASNTILLRLGAEEVIDPAYNQTLAATATEFVYKVTGGNTVKLGIHSLALKDDVNAVLSRYREVIYRRDTSTPDNIRTRVEEYNNKPLRYSIRTNPIKIKPKN